MRKAPRIVIVVLQLTAIGVYALLAKQSTEVFYQAYWRQVEGALEALNYPALVLVIVISPLLFLFRWLAHFWHGLYEMGNITSVAVSLAAVSVFWYFAVPEIAARRRGGSYIRFSNWIFEGPILGLLFLSGAGACVWAYYDITRITFFLRTGGSIGTRVASLIAVRLLFHLFWGVALIGTAVYDYLSVRKIRLSSELTGKWPGQRQTDVVPFK